MIKQKMMLVMPPGWDITQPYLALPQLKGYVNTLGHDLDIFDDNICFFDTILSEEYVTPILDEVINEFHKMDGGHIPFDKEQYNTLRLIRIYESAIREIEKSKRILKSTIDPKEEKQHFRIMSAALSAVSYYYHMSIAYDHVDSKKYDTKTIDGLLEFSLDSENNVYYEYYSSGKGRELILRSLQYEHVGLSITSRSQLLSALTFAILLKKEKNPPIIHFGGSFITRMAAYIHEDTLLQLLNNVDFLLLYEGEVVLEQLFNGIPYVRCTNVIYHDNTHIRRNEKTIFSPKEFIIPNFDGLDLSIYFSPHVSLPLVSSRGCYSNCAFCTIPQGNSSKKYHVFKIQDIIDAIHYLKYKYNTEYFTFNDETFNLKRMVNFSKAVASENIHWIAETRFDERLTDEEFETIVNSGCCFLEFGLESYNQRVLDLMEKRVKIDDIDRILDQCLRHKLPVHLFAIFGFPGETTEEIHNTQKFILSYLEKTKNMEVSYSSTGFGPFGLEFGSKVYNNPEKYGINICENPTNSIDLDHKYAVTNGLSMEDIRTHVNDFTVKNDFAYPDSLPQSFVMFNPHPEDTKLITEDRIFTDNHSDNCDHRIFTYIYNYETQWLVPVEDKSYVNGLLCVYGHSIMPSFGEEIEYQINPIIRFEDKITDPIRNVQFNIPDKILQILLYIRENGYAQCIKEATVAGLLKETYARISKLYHTGLLIP